MNGKIGDPRVERTRTRVLAAARELFLAEGLGAVTHLAVARRSGVGRKTIYRHWPTCDALVHDTLESANFPQAERTGDLRADLTAHLEALRTALVVGPLAYVIHSLAERATVNPEFEPARARLTEQGCALILEILHDAIDRNDLPADLDVESAASHLEGPLFYRVLVRNEDIAPSHVTTIVDQFLHSVSWARSTAG